MRPDRPPGRKRNGPDTTPGRPHKHSTTAHEAKATVHGAVDTAGELAAWACWTWRHRHGCGCGWAADCLLNEPLPVHPDQPCRGEFTSGGWRPCCSQEAS
jgi:hypothetical protein